MKININIKDQGEQTFYLQPEAHQTEDNQQDFILVRCMSEIDNPLIKLKLMGRTFYPEIKLETDEPKEILEAKLDSLAVAVFEAIQQGADLSAEDIPEKITNVKPYDPDLIRVETSTMSLRQVNDMIKDGDIDLSPDFQRNTVWDIQRKCRLIESILLRIPLPVFYFSADQSGRLSVVDGLQRLTAIKEFMSNNLPLKNLEYLNDCKDCTYNDGNKKLDERLYRRFNLTQITTNVIDATSPTKVKYDIFRRLNTGGRPLNQQELRNCLASNELRNALRQMSSDKAFLNATTGSISDVRMDAQECALRFIYFRHMYKQNGQSVNNYSGVMDNDLDAFVDFLTQNKNFSYDEYIFEYHQAMSNAEYLFGRHAFRKVYRETKYDSYRSVINKALFLCFSVLLADYSEKEITSKCERNSWVKVLGEAISSDKFFYSCLSYGTNGWKSLMYSFQHIKDLIQQQLNKE